MGRGIGAGYAQPVAVVEQVAEKRVAFDGTDGPAAAAVLSTALTGSNNDLDFTAPAGRAGNDTTVAYVDPGVAGAALAVSVSGQAITVSLATSAKVAASRAINPAGNDNAITWTAVTPGVAGNSITITYAVPADDNAAHPLVVDVDGTAIIATLAVSSDGSTITTTAAQLIAAMAAHPSAAALVTGALTGGDGGAGTGAGLLAAQTVLSLQNGSDGGAITSTAAEVDAAIDGEAAAAALVTPSNKAANDGTGVVTAMAATALAGGVSATRTLFTVTGLVLAKVFARCSEDLAGATATISVGTATSAAGIIPSTVATTIDANGYWYNTAYELKEVSWPNLRAQDIIQTVGTAAITDGELTYYCVWSPISANGKVV